MFWNENYFEKQPLPHSQPPSHLYKLTFTLLKNIIITLMIIHPYLTC